jgi:protein-tyrosine phosphatase
VLEALEERERLEADMQVKAALSQPITSEERNRIMQLEIQIPNYDISDPFGGPMEVYQRTAAEIEQSLRKLLTKLKNGSIHP